jgi:hypothetical protein
MLSVGPGARRLSPSQNIHIGRQFPAKPVIFITDTVSQRVHNRRDEWERDVSSRRPLGATEIGEPFGKQSPAV